MEEITNLIPGKVDIIQNSNFFKFGNDSVFLANFTKIKKGETVVDLGSGSGVIPLLLAYKQNPGRVIGLELQEKLVNMSRRSVKMNGLEDIIKIINGDLKEASSILEPNTVDVIITNPPYIPADKGKITTKKEIAIARNEIHATLEDVIREGSKLLRFGGRFSMVHLAWRLSEIIVLMNKYQIEPKRLIPIQSRWNTAAKIIIIEGRKGGRKGLNIEPAFIVYKEDSNEFTVEVLAMYDKIRGCYGEDRYGNSER